MYIRGGKTERMPCGCLASFSTSGKLIGVRDECPTAMGLFVEMGHANNALEAEEIGSRMGEHMGLSDD